MYKKILTRHVDFAWATATVVLPESRTDEMTLHLWLFVAFEGEPKYILSLG